MAQTRDLKSLEAPYHEERDARARLATLRSLHDSISHEGARAAIQKDFAPAEHRLERAIKAREAHEASGVTQQDIDQAAQREIDEREPAKDKGDE